MKAWSKKFKRDVYNNLIKTWTAEDAPDWWKWRWLCPIPKSADDNTIAGQRPIMLVEVIRKTWAALIIHRVNACWNKHDILHSSQHGFRPSRSTDTALMGLQTMFEQSSSSSSPLFLSSWDISKAFDSPSKNALRFSWTRLGVPTNVANFLVSLDEHGHTIVRTPYSHQLWKKKKYAGFPKGTKEARALFFDALRGAGQGDVGSPLNWNALFDILLCALSTVKDNRFYTHGSSDRLYPVPDIAYADDLLSGMSTLIGLQEKAKIVSAFSIIFGLDIAKSKLRSFVHSIHVEHSKPQSFYIYTTGWKKQSVPILASGTLKSLGMLYDISSEQLHKTQFEVTKLRAERSCNIVKRSRGSRSQLATVVSTCVLKRVEYVGKFSAWTKAQTEDMERPFTQTFKTLSHNLTTFPDALIYLPREVGGLGYPKLSDAIDSAKFSIQQRHLQHQSESIAMNMDTLLYNGVVNSSQVPSSECGVTTYAPELIRPDCWANSLIKFAAAGDLSLCRQGPLPVRSSTSSIISAMRPSSQEQPWRFISDRHISVLGDLYSYLQGSSPVWHDFSNTAGSSLSQLQEGNPPMDVTTLRSKQYWLPSEDSTLSDAVIVEIMGFTNHDPPHINYLLRYTNNEEKVYCLQTMKPPVLSSMLGGASSSSADPLIVLGSSPSRVYLNSPSVGSQYQQIGFIASPTAYQVPHGSGTLQTWIPSELLLILPQLGPFSIFTDGSWSMTGLSHSHVTGNSPAFLGSAGITIMSNLPNWRELPIVTFQVSNGQNLGSKSAYSMEVLGIVVGLTIATAFPDSEVTICSDCQAAVKKLNKNKHRLASLQAKTRDSSLLGVALTLLKSHKGIEIKWVKGHPEKEEADAYLWSREMWGNHLADRSAAGVLNSPIYQYQNIFDNILYLTPLPPMDALTLTAQLPPLGSWFFGTEKRQLLSSSALDRIYRKRLITYLKDRDKERLDRAKLPAKWQYYNFLLAAKFWGTDNSSSLRCMKNKLIFDKHCHPGNMAKKFKTLAEYEVAAECPFCFETDSADHWSVQCRALPRSVKIREEAIQYIKDLITTTIAKHTEKDSKLAIRHLGDDYLSFLVGDRKSPEVWRGLWTSDQLSHFGTSSYYSPPLITVLTKLFHTIGTYLTNTIIKLWQSRQVAECELAARHLSTPIPNYTEPYHVFQPPNLDLHPHTDLEISAIVLSASETAPVVQTLSIPKSNRTLKRKPVVPLVVEIHDLTEVEGAAVVVPSLDIQKYTNRFEKEKRRKRPKAHPAQTPHVKFQKAKAKSELPHWRTVQNAPSTVVVQTSVIDILTKAAETQGTTRRKASLGPQQVTFPPSPPKRRNKRVISQSTSSSASSVQAPPLQNFNSSSTFFPNQQNVPPVLPGGNRSSSSALLTACQSPVRGHDPGSMDGAYLAFSIDLFLIFLCLLFSAHDRCIQN
jgi:ribonuclease HI